MPTYKNISNVNQSYEDIKGNHKIAAPNETVTTFQLLDWLYGSDKWQKISDEPRYYPLLKCDNHNFISGQTEEWISNVPKDSKFAIILNGTNGWLNLKFNNAPNYDGKLDGSIYIFGHTYYLNANPVVVLTDGKIQTIHLYKYSASKEGMCFIYYLDKTELNGFMPFGITMQNFQLIDIGEK